MTPTAVRKLKDRILSEVRRLTPEEMETRMEATREQLRQLKKLHQETFGHPKKDPAP